MKFTSKESKTNFNQRMRELNSFQKNYNSNSFEVNSVGSNEDNNDFIMLDSLNKKKERTKSIDRPIRLRKLSKELTLPNIQLNQLASKSSNQILPKNYRSKNTSNNNKPMKSKQANEMFNSASLSELQFTQKSTSDENYSTAKKLNDLDISLSWNTRPRLKSIHTSPEKDSKFFQHLLKISNSNKNFKAIPKNSPLSFNLQPIKAAALASNLTPAFDTIFFPKIDINNKNNEQKKKLISNASSQLNETANTKNIISQDEIIEDLDLNAILYSDTVSSPTMVNNFVSKTRLSKINEETISGISGKNTRMSANWSTWSGISSALSINETYNESIIQKTNNNKLINDTIMQLSRPMHQRSKTFYHFGDMAY